MAEDKKDKKPAEGMSDKKATEQIMSLLAGLFLLAAVAAGLLAYFESLKLGAPSDFWARIVDYFFQHIWPIWKLLAGIISVLALAGIIHNSRKLRAINLEELKIYSSFPEAPVLSGESRENEAKPKNEKWKKVIEYANSDNASDWRLSIIEADVMLEELLRTLGLNGDSVGEMLKSADKNEFSTIDDAWKAHKTRNAITHSGTGFELNERETKHTIALFEKVFKEFGII